MSKYAKNYNKGWEKTYSKIWNKNWQGSFTGAYTHVWNKDYETTYTKAWVKEYLTNYEGSFTRDYTKRWVDSSVEFTKVYTQNFGADYTGLYNVVEYVAAYTTTYLSLIHI